MKTKTNPQKESLTGPDESASLGFHLAFIMGPFGTLEIVGKKSKTALSINLLLLEYEKKCAQAKIDLYNEIEKLMKKQPK